MREKWFGGREYDGIFTGVFSLEAFLGDMAIMSLALPSEDKTDLNPSSEAKVISETPTVDTSVPEGTIGKGGSVSKTYMTGTEGEEELARLVGGKSQQYRKTSLGGRYIDQLSADNIAHESKVGYRLKGSKRTICKIIDLKHIPGRNTKYRKNLICHMTNYCIP